MPVSIYIIFIILVLITFQGGSKNICFFRLSFDNRIYIFSVWQHVVCMGLDRNNIPDEYLCEVCEPRPVDRKRAKAMQARRRSELYHHSSSSDESGGNRSFKSKNKLKGPQKTDKNSTKTYSANMKKMLDKKMDRVLNKDLSNKNHWRTIPTHLHIIFEIILSFA